MLAHLEQNMGINKLSHLEQITVLNEAMRNSIILGYPVAFVLLFSLNTGTLNYKCKRVLLGNR